MNNVLYREQRKICNDYMFVDVYPVFPCGSYKTKSGKRRKRYKATSEMQKKLNDRHSEERAIEIIHANFTSDDYVITCTFKEDPESETDALKAGNNYLRRLSYMYKKQGKEFKYFSTCAAGEENGRKHFHIIVSGGISRDEIQLAWNNGYCNVDRLQFDETGISALSTYIMRQIKIGARRWRGSRNLVKPTEKKTRDHVYRRQDVIEVCQCPSTDLIAQLYPGYTLSQDPFYVDNDVNGGIYMRLMLYKDNADFMQRRKGKGIYKKDKIEKWSLHQHQLNLIGADKYEV